MKDRTTKRLFMWVTAWMDSHIGFARLPRPIALVVLIGDRMRRRRANLRDPADTPVSWGPEPLGRRRVLHRTTTGANNDVVFPEMGGAGQIFGRNVPIEFTEPQDVMHPSPRVISEKLLARNSFKPATSLNLLAAAWLQFEVHDWLSHGLNEAGDPFELELSPTDPWSHERPMRVERTKQGPPTVDGQPPTFRNTETHWWDASQVYGSAPEIENFLRTRVGGKLHLTEEGLLPFNPARFPLGREVNLAGVAGNWWVGQAMLHTLMMREHNTICDFLAAKHPDWADDRLFDQARLINAAQIARIHMTEWTPALLATPTLITALYGNWHGLLGARIKKLLGPISFGEVLSGITRSKTYHHGAPYAITEEFVAVYRMHPLIPDDYRFRRAANDSLLRETSLDKLTGVQVDDVLAEFEMHDLLYSFGTSHPGAITLQNFPNHLRQFVRPDGVTIDLATYDIVRLRERGVPRYNDFRRLMFLRPASTFEEMSDDPKIVALLAEIYRTPDDVDSMIGFLAEKVPEGCAFSDSAFRVFELMASRRLKSDRFFTYDYRPEVYTKEGLEWIETGTMSKLLLRHYPELAPALHGVSNAFTPWNVSTPTGSVRMSAAADTTARTRLASAFAPSTLERVRLPRRWKRRRHFWNRFVAFKYRHQDPSVIPLPTDAVKVPKPVPFVRVYPEIPLTRVWTADVIPEDESQRAKELFSRFQAKLSHAYPLSRPGLPEVSADATTSLHDAYPPKLAALFPMPERPAQLEPGSLATASPYASYLQVDQQGRMLWDVSELRHAEVHGGLRQLGAVVEFRFDASTSRLEPIRIETELGSSTPGDADWTASTRLAMCSLTTHMAIVRHFTWLHLAAGGPLAMATRTTLPSAHPIRRLLWPHVFGTQYSNAIVTPILLGPGGEFESVFSFTHAGLCWLVDSTVDTFDLARINPVLDEKRRGVDRPDLSSPAHDNRVELFNVIANHVKRYLAIYYPDDGKLTADTSLSRWAGAVDVAIPNGLTAFGGPVLHLESAAQILATIIFMATVDHEIVGSGLWDYQLWNDVSPVRIHADGSRVPVDVYQRLVHSNFNLNVHRTMLLDDFSGLALDPRGAAAFQRFRRDLTDLQVGYDSLPAAPWRMEPKRLKANINA